MKLFCVNLLFLKSFLKQIGIKFKEIVVEYYAYLHEQLGVYTVRRKDAVDIGAHNTQAL